MPETEIVREDRISDLPEDLLVKILSYVPIKDAVATMILSKQWLYIWTKLPMLNYRDNNDDASKKSVWWFLNKSLQLNKAPVLEWLLIDLGPQCPSDADVGKCVAKAIDSHVIFLKLRLLWSADPTSLPKTLYSCVSLKALILSDKILVDVPSTVCLPSLIMLDLKRVVYKDEDSLIRLLSSCPVLEYICVRRTKDDNVKRFTVKVTSLVELEYSNDSSDVEEDTGRSLVIDTPALTEFYFTDYSGDSCSIESSPCLEKVSVDVDWSFSDIDKLLRYFSAVSCLVSCVASTYICMFTIADSVLHNHQILSADNL